jgi:hypothetical protein
MRVGGSASRRHAGDWPQVLLYIGGASGGDEQIVDLTEQVMAGEARIVANVGGSKHGSARRANRWPNGPCLQALCNRLRDDSSLH